MPMFAIFGADPVSGQDTVDVLCSRSQDKAIDRVIERGRLVSKCIELDAKRVRMSNSAYLDAARILSKTGYPQQAKDVLIRHCNVPETGNFADARVFVPVLARSGLTDWAWSLIQQAKQAGYSGNMFNYESELCYLYELQEYVLIIDSKKDQAKSMRLAKDLAEPFSRQCPPASFESYCMSLMASRDCFELDDLLTKQCSEMYNLYTTKNSIAAILAAPEVATRLR